MTYNNLESHILCPKEKLALSTVKTFMSPSLYQENGKSIDAKRWKFCGKHMHRPRKLCEDFMQPFTRYAFGKVVYYSNQWSIWTSKSFLSWFWAIDIRYHSLSHFFPFYVLFLLEIRIKLLVWYKLLLVSLGRFWLIACSKRVNMTSLESFLLVKSFLLLFLSMQMQHLMAIFCHFSSV